jgi:carboxymethylenebutenolidase
MTVGEPEVFGEKGALGVVVVHEVFGRDDYIASVARDLGAAGFPAATVDLYDGRRATTLEQAFELRDGLTNDEVLDKMEAARAAVQRRLVPRARVGTLGFCMGGGYALLAACHRRFAFAIDYYGRIERAADIEGMDGPLLCLLASDDDRVTPWAFAELLPAARAAHKRVSVELYPNVRHAFHRPGWEGHHPETAAIAWRRTLGFLTEVASAGSPRTVK